MPERILIPAARVADVARISGASVATVKRYRRTLGDGSPRHGMLPLYEAAITKAARELPEDKQMEIPLDVALAGVDEPPDILTLTRASAAEVIALLEHPATPTDALVELMAEPVASIPTPTPAKRVRDAAPKPRRHCITVELDGRTMSVDELAQYEP